MRINEILFKNLLNFEIDKDISIDFKDCNNEFVSHVVILGSNASGKTTVLSMIRDFFDLFLTNPFDWLTRGEVNDIFQHHMNVKVNVSEITKICDLAFSKYNLYNPYFIATYDKTKIERFRKLISEKVEIDEEIASKILYDLCELINNKRLERWFLRRRQISRSSNFVIRFEDDNIGQFVCYIEDDLESEVLDLGSKLTSHKDLYGRIKVGIRDFEGKEYPEKQKDKILNLILSYKKNINSHFLDFKEKWTENIMFVVNQLYRSIGELNLLRTIRMFMPNVVKFGYSNDMVTSSFVDKIYINNEEEFLELMQIPTAAKSYLALLNYYVNHLSKKEGLMIIDNFGCLLDLDKIKALTSLVKKIHLNKSTQFIYSIRRSKTYDEIAKDKKIYLMKNESSSQRLIPIKNSNITSKELDVLMNENNSDEASYNYLDDLFKTIQKNVIKKHKN